MTKHPNAKASGISGAAGVLVIAAIGAAGITLSPVVAAAIVTVATTVTLAIGRDGIRGIVARVWRGSGS